MIVPIVHSNNGADYHRLILPLSHLGIDVSENWKDRIKQAKIVVFNRNLGFDIRLLLSLKKRYGFKIVCDLDDYWELYPNHYLYNYWKATNQAQHIKEALMNSDYVFVTTRKLEMVVKEYNNNVALIPNALPFGEGQFNDDWIPSDKFRIAFIGGVSHKWDLISIKGLFFKIANSPLRHKVETVLCGYDDRNPESKKLWGFIEKIVSADGKLGYTRRITLPLDSYMNHYRDADLTLAPLENNYFNSFKSNLKILESGCKNIPIITSVNPPRWFEDMPYVMKADTLGEWFSHVERCVEEEDFARKEGRKIGNHTRSLYNLHEVNEKRQEIFDKLWN